MTKIKTASDGPKARKYDKTYQSLLLGCDDPQNPYALPQVVDPANPKKGFSLKELYALLGCDTIEVVYVGETDLILIIDENGKCTGDNAINRYATELWWKYEPHARNQDYIVGKAVLCHTSLLK